MISVFTPTYNRRKWIRQAARSVVTQTFQDWEWVVYDVSDDDKTVQDILPDDARVVYVRGQRSGPAGDFQQALTHCTGDVVTPLADDDRLPRHALQTAHSLIGEQSWLNGRTVLVDERGDPHHLRGGTWEHVQNTRDGQYMLGGAVYWRRELTDLLGGFDSEFTGAADVDLYMRFLQHNEPVRTKEVLYIHVIHPGQDSIVNQQRQQDAARRAAERRLDAATSQR